MPLIHLRPFQGSVGSRAHSVPHAIFALTPSELLCPESPFIVTADTPIAPVTPVDRLLILALRTGRVAPGAIP